MIPTTVITERDGALLVRPVDSALDGLVDWMAANVGKGLVILAAFFRGKDGADMFSREFFFRER